MARKINGVGIPGRGIPLRHAELPRRMTVNKTAVVFFGAARSGKDTQTDVWESSLGIPVLALGKSLRDAAARKPNDPDYEPIRRGELADDGLVNWHTKGWVLKFTASELVGLNGPMRTDVQQAALIPYLRDRGFNIKVVAFTTPPEICAQRPPRPDRFEEDTNPTVILRRIEIWYKQTLPVIEAFPRYGISVKHGNLLGIDNTDLTPRQTAARILAFVGLPPMADQLFPEE